MMIVKPQSDQQRPLYANSIYSLVLKIIINKNHGIEIAYNIINYCKSNVVSE